MATTHRTYSFEAPPDLADRLAQARAGFGRLASHAPDVEDWIAREVEMGLARLRGEAGDLARDSATFMHGAVELLVGVVEKVAAGLDGEEDLRAWDREDAEGDAFQRGALRASTRIWQDE